MRRTIALLTPFGGRCHEDGDRRDSSWGLSDMAGNAQEWKVMGSSPETDPCPSTGPGGRVIRGGAWNNNADDQRAAMRSAKPAHQGFASGGQSNSCFRRMSSRRPMIGKFPGHPTMSLGDREGVET